MIFALIDILKGADILIYPLGLCSVVMVFILCERAFALRRSAVMPGELVEAVVDGQPISGGRESVLARIIEFSDRHQGDEEAVKAFARLELNRMERGLPYLDIIYAAAPLLGLTGTVWSLLRVFSALTGETGLPDPVAFSSGVALALSATLLGLTIAIPALVGGGYLQRKVENYAAQLDVILERILGRHQADAEDAKSR
jgi:biopolymer transport protein ExbB